MDASTGTPARPSRVLLIGGTGYVGDVMRFHLRAAGYAVRLLVRSGNTAQHERDGFETTHGDITDRASLERAMEGADAVVNLVAIIKERGDATFERLNYQGTVNALGAARASGARRFLQMSALGAGDLPGYPYHYTKWRAENEVRDSGLDWTIFRPSIVFGPGGKEQFVTQLADVVRKAPVIPVVGKGTSRFQPVHLQDVAEAFARALADPATIGQTYDIGGPDILTYEEILDECAAALGRRKKKVHVPVGLMKPAAAVIGALPFVEPPVTTEQLKMLDLDNTTANNALPGLLGREPIPFRGNIGYITGEAAGAALRHAHDPS